MGYKRPAYTLKFADAEFDGLEVRAKGMPLDDLLILSEVSQMDLSRGVAGVDREKLDRVLQTFASALVSWNYEDESGKPVPATVEGLRQADFRMQFAILASYLEGVTAQQLARPNSEIEGEMPMDVQ